MGLPQAFCRFLLSAVLLGKLTIDDGSRRVGDARGVRWEE